MFKKMMSLLLAGCLAVSLAACGGSDSSSAAAGGGTGGSGAAAGGELPPFKISMITQLTGNNSFGGHEYQYGAELALEHQGGEVNGRKIELVFADGPNTDATVSEFERLYNEGSRVFLSGYGCISDRTFAAMCDEMKVLYLSLAWDYDLIQGPSDYFFRGGANVTAFGGGVMEQAIGIGEQYLNIPADQLKVALVYTTRLSHVADPMKEYAAEHGVAIALEENYPDDTTDFSAIVTKLMNTDYDILIPIQGAADGTPFQKKLHEMNYTPNVTLGAGCYYDTPNFADLGNEITDGILTQSYTTPYIAEGAAPGITKFREDFEEKYGHKPLAHALQAYGGMQIYFKVLETMDPADWDDTAKVAQALKNFKAKEGELVWYWGVDFDELNNNTLANQFVVNQWVDGELKCVFPDFLKTDEAVIPWKG